MNGEAAQPRNNGCLCICSFKWCKNRDACFVLPSDPIRRGQWLDILCPDFSGDRRQKIFRRKACRVSAHHFSPEDIKPAAAPGKRRVLKRTALPLSWKVNIDHHLTFKDSEKTSTQIQMEALTELSCLEALISDVNMFEDREYFMSRLLDHTSVLRRHVLELTRRIPKHRDKGIWS